MALTKVSYSMINGESVNVLDYGADNTGSTGASTAIQAAINAGKGSVWIPDGDYLIDADLIVPNNVVIVFSGKAVFKASANNRTFFKSTTTSYFSQIWNAWLDGNGKTGVTGFDLTNFRLHAGLFNPFMTAMENGIIFRYGCFGTVIENPTTFDNVPYPINLVDNISEVVVNNPNLDNTGLQTGTAITIQSNVTVPTTGIIVNGGYIQGFVTGISDAGTGTKINGTYFEQCSNTDIIASHARNFFYQGTQHWTETGNSAIQGVGANGGTIISPTMGSGNRSVGVFNFDGTNSDCYYFSPSSDVFYNVPLGVTTGLSAFLTSQGTQTVGGIRTTNGNVGTLTANPTTLFTVSGGNRGRYDVVALIPNFGAANYTASATVIWDGSQARIIADDGGAMTLTMSGGAVQVTQTSGSTQTVYWSYLYIPI